MRFTGSIECTKGINPAWVIKVDGFEEMRYMGYTKEEAIRKYRQQKCLQRRVIEWRDYSEMEIGNLYDAVFALLRCK